MSSKTGRYVLPLFTSVAGAASHDQAGEQIVDTRTASGRFATVNGCPAGVVACSYFLDGHYTGTIYSPGNTPGFLGNLGSSTQNANGAADPNEIVVTGLRVYPTARAAALAAINFYNPISILTNTEVTGTIYRIPLMGYTYSYPTKNGPAASDNGPPCLICSAYYHTHAAFDPGYDNENFSNADVTLARQNGVAMYLGIPSGAIKVFDPATGRVTIVH